VPAGGIAGGQVRDCTFRLFSSQVFCTVSAGHAPRIRGRRPRMFALCIDGEHSIGYTLRQIVEEILHVLRFVGPAYRWILVRIAIFFEAFPCSHCKGSGQVRRVDICPGCREDAKHVERDRWTKGHNCQVCDGTGNRFRF